MPVAPLGRFWLNSSICGVPSRSEARTAKVKPPSWKGHSYLQITHVVYEGGDRSVAYSQGPPFTLTSTFDIPRAPANAMPPIGTTRRLQSSIMAATATTPMNKNYRTAAICSTVLAVSATRMPTRRIESIMRSMPKLITGPGNTRVVQSNRSNGTNGSPARYNCPVREAVSTSPTRTPNPRFGFHTAHPPHKGIRNSSKSGLCETEPINVPIP